MKHTVEAANTQNRLSKLFVAEIRIPTTKMVNPVEMEPHNLCCPINYTIKIQAALLLKPTIYFFIYKVFFFAS